MRIGALLVASLVSVSLVGAGFAAETTAPSKTAPTTAPSKAAPSGTEKKSEPAKEQRFRGDITAIDAKSGSVTVKGKTGEKTFIVGDKAKGTLEKVKVGDRLRVTYVEQGGKLQANTITEGRRRSSTGGTSGAKTGTPTSKESKDAGKPTTK